MTGLETSGGDEGGQGLGVESILGGGRGGAKDVGKSRCYGIAFQN